MRWFEELATNTAKNIMLVNNPIRREIQLGTHDLPAFSYTYQLSGCTGGYIKRAC